MNLLSIVLRDCLKLIIEESDYHSAFGIQCTCKLLNALWHDRSDPRVIDDIIDVQEAVNSDTYVRVQYPNGYTVLSIVAVGTRRYHAQYANGMPSTWECTKDGSLYAYGAYGSFDNSHTVLETSVGDGDVIRATFTTLFVGNKRIKIYFDVPEDLDISPHAPEGEGRVRTYINGERESNIVFSPEVHVPEKCDGYNNELCVEDIWSCYYECVEAIDTNRSINYYPYIVGPDDEHHAYHSVRTCEPLNWLVEKQRMTQDAYDRWSAYKIVDGKIVDRPDEPSDV